MKKLGLCLCISAVLLEVIALCGLGYAGYLLYNENPEFGWWLVSSLFFGFAGLPAYLYGESRL